MAFYVGSNTGWKTNAWKDLPVPNTALSRHYFSKEKHWTSQRGWMSPHYIAEIQWSSRKSYTTSCSQWCTSVQHCTLSNTSLVTEQNICSNCRPTKYPSFQDQGGNFKSLNHLNIDTTNPFYAPKWVIWIHHTVPSSASRWLLRVCWIYCTNYDFVYKSYPSIQVTKCFQRTWKYSGCFPKCTWMTSKTKGKKKKKTLLKY